MINAAPPQRNGSETVFFDLDGTLVDSCPGIEFSVRAAVRDVLPSQRVPDLRPFIGPAIDRIIQRALAVEDPALIKALCEAYRQSYDHEGWQLANLYPGVIDTLENASARGWRCVLLTNKPVVPTRKMIAHFNLEKYFSAVLAPGMLPNIKRSKPQALHAYCEEAGLLGRPGWVAGDSHDDAEAAERCGFEFIACRYGYGEAARQREFPVAAVIDCLTQIIGVIEDRNESRYL